MCECSDGQQSIVMLHIIRRFFCALCVIFPTPQSLLFDLDIIVMKSDYVPCLWYHDYTRWLWYPQSHPVIMALSHSMMMMNGCHILTFITFNTIRSFLVFTIEWKQLHKLLTAFIDFLLMCLYAGTHKTTSDGEVKLDRSLTQHYLVKQALDVDDDDVCNPIIS